MYGVSKGYICKEKDHRFESLHLYCIVQVLAHYEHKLFNLLHTLRPELTFNRHFHTTKVSIKRRLRVTFLRRPFPQVCTVLEVQSARKSTDIITP